MRPPLWVIAYTTPLVIHVVSGVLLNAADAGVAEPASDASETASTTPRRMRRPVIRVILLWGVRGTSNGYVEGKAMRRTGPRASTERLLRTRERRKPERRPERFSRRRR